VPLFHLLIDMNQKDKECPEEKVVVKGEYERRENENEDEIKRRYEDKQRWKDRERLNEVIASEGEERSECR